MIAQLLAFLAMLPEIFKEVQKALRLYRKARVEGWINEHREMGELIENAKTDADRRRLVRAASDLMRKSK